MSLIESFNLIKFPIDELKNLHRELTALENYFLINIGGNDPNKIQEKINKIYDVQRIIEVLVAEERQKLKIKK